MKLIFLILCIFLFFVITANSEEVIRCIDSKGNTVITTAPQDGMQCEVGQSKEESSSNQIASGRKHKSSDNLLVECNNLYDERQEINDELSPLDKRRSELQTQQSDIRRRSIEYRWSQPTEAAELRPVTEEQNKINQEMSSLYQKKSKIDNDIRTYKCDQFMQELSRGSYSSGSTGSSKSNERTTYIMRDKRVIIRH